MNNEENLGVCVTSNGLTYTPYSSDDILVKYQETKVLDGFGSIGLYNKMGSEIDIVNAARVSFGKVKDEFEESDKKLLKYLIKHKHFSPFEHITFTFIVSCPLFVRSQWMRHRTWSFNEISRRYTSEDIKFYVPSTLRVQSTNNKQCSTEEVMDSQQAEILKAGISVTHQAVFDMYNTLIDVGVCREQARGVLPQNMMTSFWATVDLRNLIQFLILRTDNHAQKEIQEYANAIIEMIRPSFPNVVEALEEELF